MKKSCVMFAMFFAVVVPAITVTGAKSFKDGQKVAVCNVSDDSGSDITVNDWHIL